MPLHIQKKQRVFISQEELYYRLQQFLMEWHGLHPGVMQFNSNNNQVCQLQAWKDHSAYEPETAPNYLSVPIGRSDSRSITVA